MSRTKLITNPFFLLHNFHPLLHSLPQPSAVHQARHLSCIEFLCTDECSGSSLPEKPEGDDCRRPRTSRNYCWLRGLRPEVVSLRPLEPPLSDALTCHSRGDNRVPQGQVVTLCHNGLVSCKINTLYF